MCLFVFHIVFASINCQLFSCIIWWRYFLSKNKSGFATYYHMKLLLIFRKYRERYFLHNKKKPHFSETSRYHMFRLYYLHSLLIYVSVSKIQPDQPQYQQMHRIKEIVDDLVLSAPLAVICQCQSEPQQCPWFLIHRNITEWYGQYLSFMEYVAEISDEYSMVFIVETQIRCCKTHHCQYDKWQDIP